MSALVTPPRLLMQQQPSNLPADVLAALEGDSDEDNDQLPLSLYFKPDELLDSPEKQQQKLQHQQQNQSQINSSSPAAPSLLAEIAKSPSPTLQLDIDPKPRAPGVLSRSASVTQSQPSRNFTRVTSVPASVIHKRRSSDASSSPPPEDLPRGNRPRRSGSNSSTHNDTPEPETPAPSNYLPRRPMTTISRNTLTSKQTNRPDFPTVTPGLSSRYNLVSSATTQASSKYLPIRRPAGGSGGSTSTPESDSAADRLSAITKDNSPVPSPRASPPLQSSQALPPSIANPLNGTANRQRLTSGRLAVPPVRARLAGLAASIADVVPEREEEDNHRVKDDLLEKDRMREKQMDVEREADKQLIQDRERELAIERAERELAKEREDREIAEIMERQRERLRELERQRDMMSPPSDRPASLDLASVGGRSRAASSSEHQHPLAPQHPRAASALDHYQRPPSVASSSKYNGVGRVETLGGPLRPGHSHPTLSAAEPSETAQRSASSRPRTLRHVAGNPSSALNDALRPSPPSHLAPSQGLSRQASAPNPTVLGVSTASTMAPSASSTTQAPSHSSSSQSRNRRNPTAPSPPATGNRLRRAPTEDNVAGSGINGYVGSAAMSQSETQKENRMSATVSASAYLATVASIEDANRLKEISNTDKENGGYVSPIDGGIGKEEREKPIVAPLSVQRQAPSPPVLQHYQQHQPPPQQQQQLDPGAPKRPTITVNRKVYQRLECIGRGGSSRVYRVVSPENAIYAIKRVSLENADQQTIEGYKNEISLLRRLEGNKRIIRLVEFDSTSSKKNLLMVMECGEVDLAKLLSEKQGEPVDFPWVTSQWQQMLQAVHVIHEEKIVHSDLKPANFVMVKGSLKLIDFGIAKAIPNDTTNIQREQQIGTVNYMSPEAIEGTHGMAGYKIMKLGRASDVWSLGCILYQMIYGHPPFYFLTMWQKMKAIPEMSHEIDFPAVAVPSVLGPRDPQTGAMGPPQRLVEHATPVPADVINTMRKCLSRDPKKRPSIPELIQERWNMRMDMAGPASTSPRRPSSPTALLRPDEAIIDANMMAQLLSYAYANPPPEATPAEIRKMVDGLLPALQNARKHRS